MENVIETKINVGKKKKTVKSVKKKNNQKQTRLPLGTLQSSALDTKKLVGVATPPEKSLKKSQEIDDSDNKLNADDLTSDEVSGTYWKNLAEERRLALAEALVENEDLHKENDTLKEEIEILRAIVEEYEKIVRT